MKDNSFYNKIHRLGRITVVCALISFMAVPFGLAAVNGISMNIPEILKNAIPLLLTFSISGICENLSFMPIIGSGALYMSCVTGNVSNMKVPAAVNAMEVAGYTAGSDRADVVAIIAVAASTFVTTAKINTKVSAGMSGTVMDSRPSASAAIFATMVSYAAEPTTLKRSHGK